ncbi:VCBS repeat-containing protein [bacterium]|nr:VCBS repeat-containing protein [bacterium]
MVRTFGFMCRCVTIAFLLGTPAGRTAYAQSFSAADMFADDPSRLMIPDIEDVSGAVFRDINGDGRPDLYLICYRGFNRLLLNSGGGVYFYDATVLSGLGGDLMPMGDRNLELSTAVADFDNDGDADVFIAGWGSTTRYYRNDGDLIFSDQSERLGVPDHIFINGAYPADVDNDGYLDLFLTDERLTNRLLLNDRSGGFTDVTREAGLLYIGTSRGAGFSDVDRDGDPDLYVANEAGSDLFYRNENGTFTPVTAVLPTLRDSLSTSGISFFDADNDGDPDLFLTRPYGETRLFFNDTQPADTAWHFSERGGTPAESSLPPGSRGSLAGDFNQDGWTDLYVVGDRENRLYLNRGDGTFIAQAAERRYAAFSSGAAAADFDGDGDLDLFTANRNTFCRFHINPVNTSRYLRFHPEGVHSNRDGLGVRVEIYAAGRGFAPGALLGMRESFGNPCLYSFSEPVIHFGLDSARIVDARVLFPSGRTVDLPGLEPGQRVRVIETGSFERLLVSLIRTVKKTVRHEDFWTGLLLILLFPVLVFLIIRLGLRRYLWSARTATTVPALFFIMAYTVILIQKNAGFLRIFLTIDAVTLGLGLTQAVHFERLLRLRRLRERYRSMLIDLSRRIVQIRDAGALLETVADHISTTTEFTATAAALYDDDAQRFTVLHCPAGYVSLTKLNGKQFRGELVRLFAHRESLAGRQLPPLLREKLVSALALKRGDRFFGCLFLAAESPVKPLTPDDAALFMSIANQMAVAAENIEYIRTSNEMIKQLTESQMREQYLRELEEKNSSLDEKNRELQRLYDELKQTETQLIHSEKMASLGQLVAGIAHELNNPIGFIYGNVKQLDTYIARIETMIPGVEHGKSPVSDLLPDLHGLIDDTLKGSRAVKELVQNLRTFSHLDQAELKPADIHEGLETCLMILHPELKDRITVTKSFEAKGIVECNIGQINQVFLNILMNAAQAIEGEGAIGVRTFNRRKQTVIEIRDSGCGIPGEILAKIFDPFYTTKDIGKGIGLGLSISYSIVENHGGKIEVESEKGKGSLFRVVLP